MGFLNEILVSFERIEADSGSCSSISDRKVKSIFTPYRVPEDLLYGTGGSNSIPVPSMQKRFNTFD